MSRRWGRPQFSPRGRQRARHAEWPGSRAPRTRSSRPRFRRRPTASSSASAARARAWSAATFLPPARGHALSDGPVDVFLSEPPTSTPASNRPATAPAPVPSAVASRRTRTGRGEELRHHQQKNHRVRRSRTGGQGPCRPCHVLGPQLGTGGRLGSDPPQNWRLVVPAGVPPSTIGNASGQMNAGNVAAVATTRVRNNCFRKVLKVVLSRFSM